MSKPLAIGIDLGTTDSCVAVFQNGAVEVISNDSGNRTTPSYVSFTQNQRSIGESAKNQVATNPDNTVFAFKRLIGRRYDDPVVRACSKLLPFKYINNNGNPHVVISYKGLPRVLSPEELSAIVLSKMKETAENYLGKQVKDAVITVPSSFNNSQRQATKNAAIIAGLNPIRIINEPTAAAIAYGFHNRGKERKVLIFDLGGGTCNVSILSIEDYFFEVIATAGNNTLGGEDFDERLMEHFIKLFKQKHNKDLTVSKRAMNRLRTQSEHVKKVLSSIAQTVVEIDSLFEGIDFYTTISRKEFEKINASLFNTALEPITRALTDARLKPYDIDEIILVGGSTRIPKIQKLLQEFFNGKELNRAMNMVEAVAHGAAIQAAILNGDKSPQLQNVLLIDVLSSSVGVETAAGVMTTVIKRNSQLPISTLYTHTCKGRSAEIKVYEGELALSRNNHLIAKFEFDLPPTSQAGADIDIRFNFDANSILKLTAFEQKSKKACTVTISDDNNLPAKEIQKIIEKVKKYHRDDEKLKEVFTVRNNLEAYCFSLKAGSNTAIAQKCDEVLTWLENCNTMDKHKMEEKRQELEEFVRNPDRVLEVETCLNICGDNLNSLKCGICNNYLSYFPVYINSDKVSVCGPCSKQTPKGGIHNTPYESLAEMFKFPCIYHSEGCLENLHPTELPLHEKNCQFRSTSCVLCDWKGPLVDLLKHFEEVHPTAVRRNAEFKVDFTHSHELSELLIIRDELFSFKRRYFQSRGILECLVSSYNPNLEYNYQIQLNDVSGDNVQLICPPERVGHMTVISQNQINNPANILGLVKIVKPGDPPSPNKHKRVNPEVNYDLLRELECPVCLNYILPPIFQCSTGHSICEECKEQILLCPICGKTIQNFHNITLEKMTELLTYPCRFTENGCDYASKPSNLKQHQKYCVHGPYSCPLRDYDGCDLKIHIRDMLVHVVNFHKKSFLESNTIEVPINGRYYNREHYMCYMIKFEELWFKLQYLYKMSVFYWAVQLIGPPEDSKKYQYEIDVCDNSDNNQRMFLRSTCSPLANKESSFDKLENYVFITLDQISCFITDTFTYKIRVIT